MNVGHDSRLSVECWAGKETIYLQLMLGDKPPPPLPTCQVQPQPQRPSRLLHHERHVEARTAAANAAW